MGEIQGHGRILPAKWKFRLSEFRRKNKNGQNDFRIQDGEKLPEGRMRLQASCVGAMF